MASFLEATTTFQFKDSCKIEHNSIAFWTQGLVPVVQSRPGSETILPVNDHCHASEMLKATWWLPGNSLERLIAGGGNHVT